MRLMSLVLAALCAIVLFTGLGHVGYIDIGEARDAEVAHELILAREPLTPPGRDLGGTRRGAAVRRASAGGVAIARARPLLVARPRARRLRPGPHPRRHRARDRGRAAVVRGDDRGARRRLPHARSVVS